MSGKTVFNLVDIDDVKEYITTVLIERDKAMEIRMRYAHLPETMTIKRAGEVIGRSYPVIKRLIGSGELKVIGKYVTKASVINYVMGIN